MPPATSAHPHAAGPTSAQTPAAAQTPPPPTDPDLDPYADSLPEDDLGLPPEQLPGQSPSSAAATPAGMPSVPSFGGAGPPSGGAVSACPRDSRSGVPCRTELSPADLDDARRDSDDPEDRLVSDDEDQRTGRPRTSRTGGGPDDRDVARRRDADRGEPAARRRDRSRGGRYPDRGGLPAGGHDHPASRYRGHRPGGSGAARLPEISGCSPTGTLLPSARAGRC